MLHQPRQGDLGGRGGMGLGNLAQPLDHGPGSVQQVSLQAPPPGTNSCGLQPAWVVVELAGKESLLQGRIGEDRHVEPFARLQDAVGLDPSIQQADLDLMGRQRNPTSRQRGVGPFDPAGREVADSHGSDGLLVHQLGHLTHLGLDGARAPTDGVPGAGRWDTVGAQFGGPRSYREWKWTSAGSDPTSWPPLRCPL